MNADAEKCLIRVHLRSSVAETAALSMGDSRNCQRPEGAGVWRPLFGVIEERWQARFGQRQIDQLRESLGALISRMDIELSHCLPILGYGLFSRVPDPWFGYYSHPSGTAGRLGRRRYRAEFAFVRPVGALS
jgi:hypothetical protein